MEDAQNLIKKTLEDLLERLLIEGEVTITTQEEGFLAAIQTQEPGVLIGYHGRNLESLQLLLNQIIYKKMNEWVRVTVTVGDYRERRESQLKEMALSAASKVQETNESVILAALTPYERRIVHLTLQTHEGVISESVGEGKNRRLVIKP